MKILEKLSRKERTWLAVAVIIGLITLLDRIIITPTYKNILKLEQEINAAEAQLSNDQSVLNQKEDVTREYQKYVRYTRRVARSDEEEMATLEETITAQADSFGVYVVNKKQPTVSETDYYREYHIEIEVEGEMESLVNFLHHLYKSEQLLRAEKITLSLKGKDSLVVKATISITKISIGSL